MTTITSKIILDSISPDNIELISIECRFPRIILAEANTHRSFSHNSASSRAIPITKLISDIKKDMYVPLVWGKNKKGMQSTEVLTGWRLHTVKFLWKFAGHTACNIAWLLTKLGLHKQFANRLIENFGHVTVLITSTEWDNFLALRNHPDAQPEIQMLAKSIEQSILGSTPTRLSFGEWHLPYVTEEEKKFTLESQKKISLARCASTSYKTVDGKEMNLVRALDLAEKLIGSSPLHASPSEHQATPDKKTKNSWKHPELHGNFNGWIQHRKTLPNETIHEYKPLLSRKKDLINEN